MVMQPIKEGQSLTMFLEMGRDPHYSSCEVLLQSDSKDPVGIYKYGLMTYGQIQRHSVGIFVGHLQWIYLWAPTMAFLWVHALFTFPL